MLPRTIISCYFKTVNYLTEQDIKTLIDRKKLASHSCLVDYIRNNSHYGFAELSKIAELANAQRDRVEEWAARAFGRSEALVFVGAAGIAVRAIAPCLRHKSTDPAVVVVDEAGRYAVPILSGHLGGANDLARRIAALTGAEAVLTTATDVNGVFAADQWARRQGLLVPWPEP